MYIPRLTKRWLWRGGELLVIASQKAGSCAEVLAPFEICVTSGKMAARQALKQIFEKLSLLSLAKEDLATIELVLAEALNNIVEHAYQEQAPHGPIRIQCHHKSNGLHFTITDQGKPMPDGQIPLGLAQSVELDPSDMPEGGYGWSLIKDLAKDVHYLRVDQENQLDLRVAVASHQK